MESGAQVVIIAGAIVTAIGAIIAAYYGTKGVLGAAKEASEPARVAALLNGWDSRSADWERERAYYATDRARWETDRLRMESEHATDRERWARQLKECQDELAAARRDPSNRTRREDLS